MLTMVNLLMLPGETSVMPYIRPLNFFGIGSHHQNGIAELCIQDLSDLAQASLLQAIYHWPDGVTETVWPFAIKHACNIWNRV